jgi:hypothetical protein
MSGELERPDPLRLRPEVEPAAGRVRGFLVRGAEQAWQSAVGHPGQQPTIVEKLNRLFERFQRAVARKPALELAPALIYQ